MLVIVKSGPDTSDGKRGMALAKDMAADVVLVQNGVYFARGLERFETDIYVLDEDLLLRGVQDAEIRTDIRKVDYGALVSLMSESDKVVGMF